MKITKFLALFTITMLFFQCNSDDEAPQINIYAACCDIPAFQMDFNPGKIYIPNMITPNGDGYNDALTFYWDDDIDQIVEFNISDVDGKNVFSFSSFIAVTKQFSWIPTAKPPGFYRYQITIRNINGDTFEESGSFCVFECDEANPLDDFSDCGWPSQYDGMGGFDPNLPSNEELCP